MNYLERYTNGEYEQVWDELLALGTMVQEAHVYPDALAVARETLRRVRSNLEQLIARLHQMGYLFGTGGFWENFPAEKKAQLEKEYPLFQPPPPDTLEQVAALEHLVGPLPLSLKCWFEEVGSVNLVGLFPNTEHGYGPVLDPLQVDSLEVALQMVSSLTKLGLWKQEPSLILAPDNYHKYGYSGAGAYHMTLPCKAVDAILEGEPHHTTFVNYLRVCMRWGGFPGLEQECRLSQEELKYLMSDLLPL